MKRLLVSCAAAAGLVLSGAGIANAGEYTGSGGSTQAPNHAASICAFSGLDRADPEATDEPPDDAVAVRGNQSPAGVYRYHGVQNYGDYVRAGMKDSPFIPPPGEACNPTKSAP